MAQGGLEPSTCCFRRRPLYPTELLGQTQSRAGDLPLSVLLRQIGVRHDRFAA